MFKKIIIFNFLLFCIFFVANAQLSDNEFSDKKGFYFKSSTEMVWHQRANFELELNDNDYFLFSGNPQSIELGISMSIGWYDPLRKYAIGAGIGASYLGVYSASNYPLFLEGSYFLFSNGRSPFLYGRIGRLQPFDLGTRLVLVTNNRTYRLEGMQSAWNARFGVGYKLHFFKHLSLDMMVDYDIKRMSYSELPYFRSNRKIALYGWAASIAIMISK